MLQGLALGPHLGWTSSDAIQSSNSGCVGGVPLAPKSLGVLTKPSPKWYSQRRFTIPRAVSGLAGAVIQFAKATRRCWSSVSASALLLATHALERTLPAAGLMAETGVVSNPTFKETAESAPGAVTSRGWVGSPRFSR